MKKYVIYAEFDTKRGKDYFVAEERKTPHGVEYFDMRGSTNYEIQKHREYTRRNYTTIF